MMYRITFKEGDVMNNDVPNKSAHWVKCDYKQLDDAGEVQTYIGQGVYCSNCRTGRHKNEVKGWVCCPNCGATIQNIIKSKGDINE